MPVVFSPGEPETRPLEPDSIVYTTAQKVADLLGIGPGEAVLASADTVANAVFVTGADYRAHGFAVGDSILVYSDAFPVGFTAEITTIVSGGGNGVKLNLIKINSPGVAEGASIAAHVDLTDVAVADNTYVQNTASFTNGKLRGMKKSVVETRIKEIQDRIDNITHNAWRPYLVSAEYLNFDTYKPYRRRYYTDYVGTTPLLFRNVQQILRLEVWQGDDYRELAGAEVRLEIVDYSALSTYSIYMCPGGGGVAKLAVGAGTEQWAAAFNTVTTAQNLADLINKEDRTNRGPVTFTTNSDSPAGTTYNQPDGASSSGLTGVHVNDEFIATANADYGNGKLKVSSMQQTKGGEECSMIIYDTTDTGTAMTSTGKVISADMEYDANGGTGGIPCLKILGSSDFAEYGVVDADRTGVFSSAVAYNNKIEVAGYTTLEGLTVLAGPALTDTQTYTVVQTRFQSDIGQYSDAGGDQARLRDWWLDHEMGIIYFNNSYPFFEWNAVKATYIYGERYLEQAIQEAATKLVASELLMSDDRSVLIPEGSQNIDLGSKVQLWRKEAMDILSRYKEVVVFS